MWKTIEHDQEPARAIDADWELASTTAGMFTTPQALPDTLAWSPAAVPGTVAAARRANGQSPQHPRPTAEDHWYRVRFEASGAETLRFHGLATLATVWLNGREILASRNMFLSHDVDVELFGCNELVVCFRALEPALAAMPGGGRWRPRMIAPASLRHVRTSALGHMSGWCPDIPTVGPWRGIERLGKKAGVRTQIKVSLAGTTGIVEAQVETPTRIHSRVEIACAGRTAQLAPDGRGRYAGRLEIPDVELWWPHTHGAPTLHDVIAVVDGRITPLGRVGFRSIDIDRGPDGAGFGLVVNGTPIFCRGAVWSSADLVAMPTGRDAFLPWLRLTRDAGANMIRIPGTTVYEADALYELCDELGLLVWQDFMFANFDYPATDAEFAASVRAEARQFLERTALSPSITVLCGGSEVYQQAAMLGLPERKWRSPIFEEWLPGLVQQIRPDVPYVVGSPSGGALPFVVDEGVGHYFGVGAYRRPLTDARMARVRFASECLAFANVPPEVTTPTGEPALGDVTDPRWKTRIPRDAGASWDFEDVRDHYLEEIFGERASALRTEHPDRYLELSRAAQAVVFEHALTEFYRAGSPTRGALALMLQDLQPGAGWGIVSSCGVPKSPWYAMRRVFRPVGVTLTDEGVNGLGIHLANETATARDVVLHLAAWRDGRTQVLGAKHGMTLAARSRVTHSAFSLIGAFFDISYAYRFNGPQHDATVATLKDRHTGEVLSEAFHFPLGHARNVSEGSFEVRVEEDDGGWALVLSAERLSRFVHIVDPDFLPEDDWFHLAPKTPRRIRLAPRGTGGARPKGRVRALNVAAPLAYEARS